MAAAILLFLFQGAGRKLSTECRKGPETWCKGDERTGPCGGLCTKSAPAERRKGPETWCKGDERTRFCGGLCTKPVPAER